MIPTDLQGSCARRADLCVSLFIERVSFPHSSLSPSHLSAGLSGSPSVSVRVLFLSVLSSFPFAFPPLFPLSLRSPLFSCLSAFVAPHLFSSFSLHASIHTSRRSQALLLSSSLNNDAWYTCIDFYAPEPLVRLSARKPFFELTLRTRTALLQTSRPRQYAYTLSLRMPTLPLTLPSLTQYPWRQAGANTPIASTKVAVALPRLDGFSEQHFHT